MGRNEKEKFKEKQSEMIRDLRKELSVSKQQHFAKVKEHEDIISSLQTRITALEKLASRQNEDEDDDDDEDDEDDEDAEGPLCGAVVPPNQGDQALAGGNSQQEKETQDLINTNHAQTLQFLKDKKQKESD